MLLKSKAAVVYSASGNVGRAIARAFAREGAKVFLTGRSLDKVEAIAESIRRESGWAQAADVDALDEAAVKRHLDEVVAAAGAVHVSFNAIGIPQEGIQGRPLVELDVDAFMAPARTYLCSHFLTARSAARHMVAQRTGTILSHTPEPARLGVPGVGGMGPAWAALEGLNRQLSAEVAQHGVRVVCIRTSGLPETPTIDVVYGLHARALGIAREQFQAMLESMSHTKRSTRLAELADAAVFLASDLGRGMTGTVANLTGGLVVD
jgi:NAD(P)-dependent dehydrogenase (short-subunit alcohol dehydrogenase family)